MSKMLRHSPAFLVNRLNKAEAERDQARARVAELEATANVSRCSYCGDESRKDDVDGILAHIEACPKRPEARLLDIAAKYEDAVRELLRRARETDDDIAESIALAALAPTEDPTS